MLISGPKAGVETNPQEKPNNKGFELKPEPVLESLGFSPGRNETEELLRLELALESALRARELKSALLLALELSLSPVPAQPLRKEPGNPDWGLPGIGFLLRQPWGLVFFMKR